MAEYTEEQKRTAKMLWQSGIPGAEIVRLCGLNNIRIIYTWRDKEKWDKGSSTANVELNVSIRYNSIIDSPDPLTPQQMNEAKFLSAELLKFTKIEALERGESVGRGRTPGVKNGQGKKKKPKKNDVSHLTAEQFLEFRKSQLYPHQVDWYEAGIEKYTDPEFKDREGKLVELYRNKVRFIMKSRKIGATWYFAYEAFEDAVLNNNNQAFVSATRAQAEVFKAYISAIAKEYFDVEISGNPTTLINGKHETMLYYLSTNILSAQTVGGSVYFDECFWTRNFSELYDVASPIASFAKHRITLISTPSAISHPAYPKWTGKEYNEDRAEKDKVSFSVSHGALKKGRLCEDDIWRQVVTLEDAVERGFDLISVKERKKNVPPNKYANFYNCKFVDDSDSYFKLSKLLALAEDPLVIPHFDAESDRPYGNRHVSIGYDPGGKQHFDAAALTSVPTNDHEPFYALDQHMMRNMPSYKQFERVREWMNKYNVTHFEFDTTGAGQDMEKYAEKEFPNCTPVRYNPMYKTAMVNKASDLFETGRFKYDINNKAIPLAFMTVYETTTAKTGQITYASRETQEAGHGDLAWAFMHSFMCEDFVPDHQGVTGGVY
ncbi:hypothetical protein EOL70_13415 [Leucothrix sargassi]|nr:hypothetical protein EOL70_13415 [Leucothrix sargassi]